MRGRREPGARPGRRQPSVHPGGGIYHTVKPGETLWRISKIYGVDLKALARANSVGDTNAIAGGQRLFIPGAYQKAEYAEPPALNDSFIWPVSGAVIAFFGAKIDNSRNKGIDIRIQEGAVVRASRSGRVVFCDNSFKGFGRTVILDHGDGYQTVYAYNSALLVNPGDTVGKNGVIARVGKTGRAKGPSLHFEVRKENLARPRTGDPAASRWQNSPSASWWR